MFTYLLGAGTGPNIRKPPEHDFDYFECSQFVVEVYLSDEYHDYPFTDVQNLTIEITWVNQPPTFLPDTNYSSIMTERQVGIWSK